MQVNMFEAKTNLSKLVKLLEERTESEIVLARDGEPVARLLPFEETSDVNRRIGIARKKYPELALHEDLFSFENLQQMDEEIAVLFEGDGDAEVALFLGTEEDKGEKG